MTTDNVDLEGLTAPRTVTLRGRAYEVKPFDGYSYRQLALAESKKKDDNSTALDILYRLAAKVLAPAMTEEKVFGTESVQGLTAEEVGSVLGTAQSQIHEVEAAAPPNSGAAAVTQRV